MKKHLQKPGTFQIVLVLWLVISVVYIMHDMWQNGVSATYKLGYQAGEAQAVANVIAASQQCQPFNIFAGESKADLINVACLEQLAAQAQQGGAPEAESVMIDES